MNHCLFGAYIMALLTLPHAAEAEEKGSQYSYTGRMSGDEIEIADVQSGKNSAMPREAVEGFTGGVLEPLSGKSISAAIQSQSAKLQCEGYEPFFDLSLSKAGIFLRIGDTTSLDDAPLMFNQVTGLTRYLTYRTQDSLHFGVIEVNSSRMEADDYCSFGLESDGFQSCISVIHSAGPMALASCCHLIWGDG
jgi:hypothetical protein